MDKHLNEHDHENEMTSDLEDVVALGKEMEQISEQNEEDRDNDWSESPHKPQDR